MGKDFSPKIRQRADLSRKQARRASYDRLLIVCEGSKTEPNYFKEIRQTYRLHTANVAIHPSKLGTAPIQVVQYAKELFENGNAHMQIKARAFEQVFVVFDRDNHDSYFDALRLTNSLDGKIKNDDGELILFHPIVSVPNFELWLLLHFEDVQHSMHRDEVLKRLKQYILNYDKAILNCFSITQDKLDIAYRRAQLLSERNTALEGSLPYTDIWKLVMLPTKLKA